MINLYNMDCMEALQAAPDNYWDLAIVDPPYGINRDKEVIKEYTEKRLCKWKKPKHKNYIKKDWDKQPPNKIYFDELFRVSKKQIIWGANYFNEYLPTTGGRIIWDKKTSMPTFSQGEIAFISCIKSVKFFRFLWNGFAKAEPINRIHPTEKPVALYTWLLSKYAKKGDKILDTHLGSGSSAIAAHKAGYDFWGYEIDKDYFNAASKRLKEVQKQLLLF